MRVLVVSANMGSSISNVMVPQKGVEADFVCYNNTNYPLRKSSFTSRMRGKIPKMLAWMLNPGYDYYVWMDSYFNMKREDAVAWFVEQIQDKDALFFRHPRRNSVVDEAKFMKDRVIEHNDNYLKQRIDGEPVVEQALSYLADEDFEDNFLIAASSFCYSSRLVRNKDCNVMKEWYFHTCVGSVRDQISLPYVLSKFKTNYVILDENVFGCKYLK